MREQIGRDIFKEVFRKNEMVDMGQIDMREITRRYGEEKTVRMMKEIMEIN